MLLPTELRSHTVESSSICWAHVFPWKECSMKGVLYEVRCLKSTEDMILALAGQFKQLSHEPEKFRWLNGIRTHDLCYAGAVLLPTELRSHTVESSSICWAHVFPRKECSMKEILYEVHIIFLSYNCLNCPESARIISSFDFKHRTSYNISFARGMLARWIHCRSTVCKSSCNGQYMQKLFMIKLGPQCIPVV